MYHILMTKNCYIHIPFCTSKCNYCSFVSYPYVEKITGYVYSLLKEISVHYDNEPLETLYIGGGTPSLLPPQLLQKIVSKFKFTENAEKTIEVNPEDVTESLINNYLNLGFNRISMGIQSLDDNILKICGRRHSAQKALEAIDIIKTSGCENINVDLIYGLPNQDKKSFINDIKILTQAPITHISLYGLKIEEGCAFAKNTPSNLPDDDSQADMYEFACKTLPEQDFFQYEISNFAKKGFESRHNLNYWNNNTYYGFGVSAHSFVNGFRCYNTSSIEEYMSAPDIVEYAHHITEKESLEETIFLGLRKYSGINLSSINSKYNINFQEKYKSIIDKYKDDYLIIENDNLRFSTKGFMLSNIILSEFI